VDAGRQIAALYAPIDRHCKFLDDFARTRGDDLGSKHLAVWCVDNFDETVQVLVGDSPVDVVELPASDPHRVTARKARTGVHFR
jgi:hypothetical protein